ncbi:heme-binding protein [Burkholderia cenocepacia]|uniref:heme-binding protein n=1 Tax=Burkholderia cenocepacia TaxID=95486 RepID=UPI000F5A59E0|nr:heme-binding protein [Burkholderia cenocepacia]RQU84316.1 hypothetical protein DF040_33015 [Burkholderia cenocepacia]
MVTPPFRLAPHAFDDDTSNPALPHFNAAVARRMGEIAVNLASRRGLPIAVGIVGGHAPLFYCALDGGGVPLRLAGAGIVGAMTIAGLGSEANHALVVECLRWHVGANALAMSA